MNKRIEIKIIQFKKFIGFFTLFCCACLNGSPVSEVLKEIPKEHRQDLEYLFSNIFLQYDGAYTIFGDKPVSSAASFLIPSWKATLMGYPVKLGKSWETWLKYKHKFPMRKYAIVSERIASKKSGSVALYLYVIDKEKFVETINNNLELFEVVLHTPIDAEKILDDIVTGKSTLLTSLHQNEMLFGILLGYGKHNAYLYERSKCSRAAPILFPTKIILKTFSESHPMMRLTPLQFKADLDHPQTIALQKKYHDLQSKISHIYSEGDFLEITLTRLTSD